MAEKITVGLKKTGSHERHTESDKAVDIELTDEDLKQIAAGTTVAIQHQAK